MRREYDCDGFCDLLRLNLHVKIKGSFKSYATVVMSTKYIDQTLVVFELSVSKQICFWLVVFLVFFFCNVKLETDSPSAIDPIISSRRKRQHL